MLSDRDFQQLLHYQAKHPMLSVYLSTDPAEGNADAHKLRLRSMLKDVDLSEDVEVVLRYMDHEHDWSGRSIAIFSCVPEDFLKAFPLAVPLRNRVRISDRPSVKPLADLLDSYGGYGLVLVDKQGARLFYFHLGEMQEQEGIVGESVRRTKHGGGSQAPGRRGGVAGQTGYVDEVADRNMKEAVEYSIRFFNEKNVRRILIGGTEDNVALFRNQLPKAYQSLVIGNFPISKFASQQEVMEKALEIGKEAEYRREAHLVNTVVTNAAKGRNGVVNLEDTLAAIREGRIQTLLYRDGYRVIGSRCKSCGFLALQAVEPCQYCGGETEEIPDIVELAVHQVMQSGGEVEVLQRNQLIKGFDQIGALLRY
jgi:peptide chain release factor subunit 1